MSSIPGHGVCKEENETFAEAGLFLRDSRLKKNMTQKELADLIGASQHHISEMEHGKRSIGKEMAKKLSEVFQKNYRRFL